SLHAQEILLLETITNPGTNAICPIAGFQDDLPVTKMDDTPVTNFSTSQKHDTLLMNQASSVQNFNNAITQFALMNSVLKYHLYCSTVVLIEGAAAGMNDSIENLEENKQTEDTDARVITCSAVTNAIRLCKLPNSLHIHLKIIEIHNKCVLELITSTNPVEGHAGKNRVLDILHGRFYF
ncbi:hypothetical protein ACJX0J_013875, partial [Zea mays]